MRIVGGNGDKAAVVAAQIIQIDILRVYSGIVYNIDADIVGAIPRVDLDLATLKAVRRSNAGRGLILQRLRIGVVAVPVGIGHGRGDQAALRYRNAFRIQRCKGRINKIVGIDLIALRIRIRYRYIGGRPILDHIQGDILCYRG